MKITTERLPKSLLALDIELDKDQVEKGLDRAARRLSQKYTVPGFRKGKAPRFIIENYFGREALMEEASEDLINKSFREAMERENIQPVGPPNLETFDPSGPFRFRVTVPVQPSVTLPDYRTIRIPLEREPVTDEMVQQAMEARRDKHAVLRELDEPRPAQQSDQLTVKLESFVDGESLEQYPEDQERPDSTLVLEPDRLVNELYDGLLGASMGEEREITAQMGDDHPNEQVRGKEVLFKVQVVGIQERILPDWEELPTLEDTEGSLDDLRASTRETLEQNIQNEAEKDLVNRFIDQLVAETTFDIPDVLIEESAEDLLESYGQQFRSYGISLDQMLQYRNQTREEAIAELLPTAEERLQRRLALMEVVRAEQLDISESEVGEEASKILDSLDEETVAALTQQQGLSNQFLTNIANSVLDRKLTARMIEIARGEAPALPESTAESTAEASAEPQPTASADEPDDEDSVGVAAADDATSESETRS